MTCSSTPRPCLKTAALLGGSAVALGAFGAHGLKEQVSPEHLAVFETAVRYQFYHSLALLALSLAGGSLWESRWCHATAWLWLVGTLIFSCSLYLLVLSGQSWLGAITPIGGIALVVGWGTLILAARNKGAS